MYRIPLAAAVTLTLVACSASTSGTSMGRTSDAPPSVTATTQLLGKSGELRGTARLEQRSAGTMVSANVEGMAPGSYAIHIHTTGKCDAPDFTTAGPHFNPTGRQHGRDNPQGAHAGDLPNIEVGADGRGSIAFEVAGLTLTGGTAPVLDADGGAVVVHAGPDDYKTDPSGNSGGRIACGVVAAR